MLEDFRLNLRQIQVRERVTVADGYDPTLGIMHESRDGSSAFVFDMMEPERPKVDRSILEFVNARKFRAADFAIRSDGVCRLNPELARHVAQVVCKGIRVGFIRQP